MYLGRVMTTRFKIQSGYIKDPCGIHAGSMRDPCGIHVSAEVRGYMQDTCMILVHARLIKDTCGINVSAVVRGYMRDTYGILQRYILRYMYLKYINRATSKW